MTIDEEKDDVLYELRQATQRIRQARESRLLNDNESAHLNMHLARERLEDACSLLTVEREKAEIS